MKKVVINKCYGGFEISFKALKILIEMKSPIVEKITLKKYFGSLGIPNFDSNEYISLGKYKYQKYYLNNLFDKKHAYTLFTKYEFEGLREHPDLIKVVEKLGDGANGRFSELKIVEIPDDVDYEIEDYDGLESIHEKHRVW